MQLVLCKTKKQLEQMDFWTDNKFSFSVRNPPLYVDPDNGNIVPVTKLEQNNTTLVLTYDEYIKNQSVKFVNLTDHEVHDIESGILIPPSGDVLRVSYKRVLCNNLNGINVYCTEVVLENLPPKKTNTYYIVSNLAINYIPDDRDDFLAPGNVVRDEKTGKPIGCKGLRPKTIYI